jgi:hypothetical protein
MIFYVGNVHFVGSFKDLQNIFVVYVIFKIVLTIRLEINKINVNYKLTKIINI